MIRSELCAVAGLTVADFNALFRSGDLPFETNLADEIKDQQGRIWSNFTLDHATLLLAAGQLTSAGLTWREAAALLREPRSPVARSLGAPAASYCVARAEFMREGGGAPSQRPGFTVYGGSLADIVATAQAEVAQYNRHNARNEHQRIALVSLVATDLTRARRAARARIEELGMAPEQMLRIDPDGIPSTP